MLEVECQLSGFYKLTQFRDGQIVQEAQTENIIVDAGFEALGTVNNSGNYGPANHIIRNLVVGTGNKEPEPSDSSLQTQRAAALSSIISQSVETVDEVEYIYILYRASFGQGAASGNLSEVGATGLGGLFSRSLFRDSAGLPTTITVLDMDYLTLEYTLRVRVPPDTVKTIMVMDGTTPISTTVTIRAIEILSGINFDAWCPRPVTVWPGNQYGLTILDRASLPPKTQYSVAAGQVTAAKLAYVPGSYVQGCAFTIPVGLGNSFPLQCISTKTVVGAWCLLFNPPIPKDNTRNVRLEFSVRYHR